jgi:RNA polymerase sigma-70 factor (ECF subfamily)
VRPLADKELDELDRSYRPALMSFFLRRLKNSAEAEDLTQEVLLRLAKVDRSELQTPSAYIFSMAANLLRDRARREQVRGDYRGELALDEAFGIDMLDPARIMSGQQALTLLQTALTELPKLTRVIFILHRIENVQRREIARTYRISEAAVDRHLAKAMSYLIARVRGDSG